MKRKVNDFQSIVSRFIKFIDKKIIISITRYAVSIRKNFMSDNKYFERMISRKSTLLFISLIMALGVFFIIDTKSIVMLETSAEVLYNQNVTVQYNEEAYVLEGVPETVDITLIGRKSDLYLARQIPNHEVTLDLSGLKPGAHKVDLKYKRVLESINYKLDPSVVTVTIHSKVSEVKTINIDVLNMDNLDPKLIIDNIEIERDDVIVKGAEDTLDKVATIKALIDVDNFVNPEVGDLDFKDIPLVAYDELGNIVDVEIVPSKVNAIISIASPSKVVPIQVIPTGNVTFGKAISNIDLDIKDVTIYGEESILTNINSIPVEIDVDGLKGNKKYSVSLEKPVGVRYMKGGIININVQISDEVAVEFENIGIEYQNLGNNYTVNAKTENDQRVTVIVKGVQSVIDEIDSNDIRAYVDLKGYGVGEHEVDVLIERSDFKVTYLPKIKKVTLIIKANK
ncbi:MAG: CdaR family protein [Bacilli bacterium]|jgi:YbbR domain-containing protein|nr:CdaR family protein [Bacilli bacterium]